MIEPSPPGDVRLTELDLTARAYEGVDKLEARQPTAWLGDRRRWKKERDGYLDDVVALKNLLTECLDVLRSTEVDDPDDDDGEDGLAAVLASLKKRVIAMLAKT